MAIRDFLTGGRSKRARAKRLLGRIGEPFGRLHAAIREAGTAQFGDGFEAIWTRFADCRLYRPGELGSLPAQELVALDRFAASQQLAARALLQEVKAAFAQVQEEWADDDLVSAATGGGLRALARLDDLTAPAAAADRLLRSIALVEVDMACSDVRGELRHIAESPTLFW